jgi:hypothetical protein
MIEFPPKSWTGPIWFFALFLLYLVFLPALIFSVILAVIRQFFGLEVNLLLLAIITVIFLSAHSSVFGLIRFLAIGFCLPASLVFCFAFFNTSLMEGVGR